MNNSNIFNSEFFPTPEHVLDMMGIDCLNRVCLEPSAGKGNIVDYLKKNDAREVLACESHVDLAEIVKTKARFLQHDFLTLRPEQISHIQLIVMNPPFSNADKHILHAWEIAPAGCEIIALCNSDTLDNDYTSRRKNLLNTIKDYGNSSNLGNVFSDSERATNVSIGLIKLYKPGQGSNEFDGFFLEDEPEELQENGIMRFDGIKDIVQRYVGAVKLFDEHLIISDRMSSLTRPFGIGGFSIEVGHDNQIYDRETFKKELQKKAWRHLFDLMKLNKYLTSGVMEDINKFVEQQTKIPFTMKNIYKMFEIIVGTKDQIFDRALEEAVDKFTKHTHENRFNVEGWKTNAGYMLNPRFIIDWAVEYSKYSDSISPRYSGSTDKLQDLIKVLCSITATTDFEHNYNIHYLIKKENNIEQMKPNVWYNYSFFEVKGFKKGTMHIKFKDPKVCELLNRRYAKIKGQVLPEKFTI